MKYRFLIFGAHPDDCDLAFGGTALQLLKAGHEVKFVSVTNGDAGHHIMQPAELAARRKAETQRSAQVAGLTEYEVLDTCADYPYYPPFQSACGSDAPSV